MNLNSSSHNLSSYKISHCERRVPVCEFEFFNPSFFSLYHAAIWSHCFYRESLPSCGFSFYHSWMRRKIAQSPSISSWWILWDVGNIISKSADIAAAHYCCVTTSQRSCDRLESETEATEVHLTLSHVHKSSFRQLASSYCGQPLEDAHGQQQYSNKLWPLK